MRLQPRLDTVVGVLDRLFCGGGQAGRRTSSQSSDDERIMGSMWGLLSIWLRMDVAILSQLIPNRASKMTPLQICFCAGRRCNDNCRAFTEQMFRFMIGVDTERSALKTFPAGIGNEILRSLNGQKTLLKDNFVKQKGYSDDRHPHHCNNINPLRSTALPSIRASWQVRAHPILLNSTACTSRHIAPLPAILLLPANRPTLCLLASTFICCGLSRRPRRIPPLHRCRDQPAACRGALRDAGSCPARLHRL